MALSEAQPLALKSARELLEVGHGLELLPRISEAYEAGLLSWDQVVALVRFATPETDAELAESARSASVAQLQAAARRARAQSAPPGRRQPPQEKSEVALEPRRVLARPLGASSRRPGRGGGDRPGAALVPGAAASLRAL